MAVFLGSLAASVGHYRRRAEIERATAAVERMKRQMTAYRRAYIEGPGAERALREAEAKIVAAEKRLNELTGVE